MSFNASFQFTKKKIEKINCSIIMSVFGTAVAVVVVV